MANSKHKKTIKIKDKEGVQVLPDGRIVVVTSDLDTTDLANLPRRITAFFMDFTNKEDSKRGKDALYGILQALTPFLPTEQQGVKGFEKDMS